MKGKGRKREGKGKRSNARREEERRVRVTERNGRRTGGINKGRSEGKGGMTGVT